MQTKKVTITLSLLLVLALVLTGCTSNQKALFDASMKMQEVNSVQEHLTMSMELSGSGLDPMVQEQVNQIAAMLNEAKIEVVVKSQANADKTMALAEADMSFRMPGLELSMPFWVDMDLAGDNPKLIEIFKMPAMVKASFPPEYMSKDYMVMDLTNNNSSELNTLDMSKLMDYTMNFQTEWNDFMLSYAERFNPNLEVVKVPVQDSSLQKYTISLDDKGFKDLLSYTVNSFAQDEEALSFINDYFEMVFELSGAPLAQDPMYSEMPFMEPGSSEEVLNQINALLESLQDVTIIGESGINLEYTISEGYIIESGGSINLQLDLSQIAAMMNITGEAVEVPEVSGILNLVINFNNEVSNINQPLDIQIPELTKENSFDYFEFIESTLAAIEPIQEPAVTRNYTVKPGDTLATIALNNYGSYDKHASIYQANLDVFKKSNNRLDAGMVLTLPAEGLLAPLPTDNIKQVYTVKAGDTLGTIAKQMYGDSSQYTKIYEANKDRLKNPNLVFEGQNLVIPK